MADGTGEVCREVLGTTGDVDPIDHDGGVVFLDPEGVAVWTWCERESDDDDALILVYQCDVPDDVFDEYDWADPAEIAETCGWDSAECLIEAGMSEDPMTRVAALEAIKDYEGSRCLDETPQTMTADELERHWAWWL